MDVEVIARAGDGVGESAHWEAAAGALWWVDILSRRVRRVEVATGRIDDWPAPDFPTAIALRRDRPGAVVALARSVALFDLDGRFEDIAVPEPDIPANRLNEGKADPHGNFWVGSMETNLAPDGAARPITRASGALWRIDPQGRAERLTAPGFGITNTMAWDADARRFLTADTLRNEIYDYAWDPETGALGGRRVLSRGAGPGLPDGSCLDAEGCLWNARFGGGCLVRFAPDGTIDRTVALPVANPTSCTFGGDGLRTLFVTSARFSLTPDQIAANPDEGGVLAVDPGVAGRPETRFAG